MSRGRKIRCRGPRARPSSIAMPSRSASGRRSGGSRGRVRLNRACHGNTRTGQDPEENVRNPPNRAEDGFASVEPRIPRSRYRAVLGAAAEQQDDMVEVVLRFHVRQDGRISVLLEDRRRAERAFEAMDLVRPDDAAKRVKGLSMLFTIVGSRL